ncbi:ermin [Paroedura picta]|uniref:ermin n=1 Tax=Paroedura picta TaxID=143630 RepID=UPI0010155B98
MTEDVEVRSGVPEYNRDVPSEKPQLQVIDIIDQMANTVEIIPYENEEFTPDSLLMQENQEGEDHVVEYLAGGDSSGEKDNQGLCEESYPVSARAHEGTEQEEGDTEQLSEEQAHSTHEDQEEPQRHEHNEPIEIERCLDVKENATVDEPEGAEGAMQNENNGEPHKKWPGTNSKKFLPVDPRSNSPTEKPSEQLSSMKKSDISRHSYSRYNTISYRKIRKGNTKQRIDEFESMMHS